MGKKNEKFRRDLHRITIASLSKHLDAAAIAYLNKRMVENPLLTPEEIGLEYAELCNGKEQPHVNDSPVLYGRTNIKEVLK
jgi:hypothetical protein